jgi:hypothetical protein
MGQDVIEPLEPPEVKDIDVPPLAFIPDLDWHRERVAFYRMLPDLLRTHRDKFVAILGAAVVGDGDDARYVSLEAHRRYGEVPIYIGLVSDQPAKPVRIPSARIVRNPGKR